MALIQQHSCDKCRCIITEENGYINLHMKSGDKTNPSVLVNGGATGPLPPPELENNSGTSRVSRCVSVAASLAGHP